jgi:hypothetical protein
MAKGFMRDLYWLRIQRDKKKEGNLEGVHGGGEEEEGREGAYSQRQVGEAAA